jgi:hypothetical protein
MYLLCPPGRNRDKVAAKTWCGHIPTSTCPQARLPCVCGNADASKCTLQLNSKKNIFLQIFWCSKHVSSDWKSYFEVYRLIATHPFILHTRFLKFLEIWFEKSGLRYLVREKWFTRKKVGLYYKSTFFQVGEKWFCKLGIFFLVREKWLTRKKNHIISELDGVTHI